MELIGTYRSLSIADIDRFIQEKKEEDLYLDFKEVAESNLSRDDRKNLAKALSGFANSSGGLIVWGVEARKNQEGIDCATAKREIENVRIFVSRLQSLTGESVSPIVEGIEHRFIESGSDRGFAITYVPPSDSGPHMAKGGEDRYYKRSGDSFYKMEHFDIEDMFGRRKKPKLEIELVPSLGGSRSGGGSKRTIHNVYVMINLKNSGRGSATAPYVVLKIHEPHSRSKYGLDGNGRDGFPLLFHSPRPEELRFGADATTVIHPNTTRTITSVTVEIDDQLTREVPDLKIDYQIAAQDTRLFTGTTHLSAADMIRLVIDSS